MKIEAPPIINRMRSKVANKVKNKTEEEEEEKKKNKEEA